MRWMLGSLVGLSVLLVGACQGAPSLVASGAAGRQPAARALAADHYPVTAGSRWEYQLHQRQANGETQTRPMTIAIERAETRPDGVVEAVTARRYQGWSPPATRVLKHPDRVVLSRLSDPEDGPSITVLKLPLEAGASWPGRPLAGGHTETVKAIGREAVTVGAGTFEAFRVDHALAYANGDSDTLQYWYAAGVGVVKMIERSTLYQNGQPLKLEVTGELERYTIGPDQLKR